MSFDSDTLPFQVVINPEEQYSIWPDYRPIPAGWRAVGFSGQRRQCLEYIETHWTDMRPASLRAAMDGHAAAGVDAQASDTAAR
ncbi:MbtH family NRPS accessory protein [Cupriavidus gilardii]|uniref:MbtH family protein n=1 Tax=Cupriavidus gilardii TaxID=82541 RepID=UPI001EE55072|nr:MbtH family NRPS accessory protein [Cupriavidus gilardii]MCG5263328.1 MbtH family NRPS accessory protein [Cupriavidus gilardii]MDF9431313.1 MbtH family NRPS accessory protein [Cupriavidus gilardii]